MSGRVALQRGVHGLRDQRRPATTIGVLTLVAIIGLYGIATFGNGLAFGYDFFDEPAPSSTADAVAVVSLGVMALLVAIVSTLSFGALCVLMRQPCTAGSAVRSSARRLLRDGWWSVPAFAITAFAVMLVFPGPLLVGVFAGVAVSRLDPERQRRTTRSTSFGPRVIIGLLSSGWALVVWCLAAIAVVFPSPSTPIAALIVVLGVSVSIGVMACTAAANVELHVHRSRPVVWAPPGLPPQRAALPPPGWYVEGGATRWWDGTTWTAPGPTGTQLSPDVDAGRSTGLPVFSHVGFFMLAVLLPLIFRLTEGRTNAYVRHHSTEALNFQLTFVLAWNACGVPVYWSLFSSDDESSPIWLVVAVLIMFAMFIVAGWLSVLGAIRANEGVWWRYPVSIRFVRGARRRTES